ncbi:hypothetical protein B0H14DRAFT_2567901 [Mycena olivaceomarginata]|nr:hypothetical protein B0H14DRAFT_2567901 [Mycena olivaceomarginata]
MPGIENISPQSARSVAQRRRRERERRERGDATTRPRNAARSRARRRNEESDRQRGMNVDAPMDLRAAAAPANRPSRVLQALNNGLKTPLPTQFQPARANSNRGNANAAHARDIQHFQRVALNFTRSVNFAPKWPGRPQISAVAKQTWNISVGSVANYSGSVGLAKIATTEGTGGAEMPVLTESHSCPNPSGQYRSTSCASAQA